MVGKLLTIIMMFHKTSNYSVLIEVKLRILQKIRIVPELFVSENIFVLRVYFGHKFSIVVEQVGGNRVGGQQKE